MKSLILAASVGTVLALSACSEAKAPEAVDESATTETTDGTVPMNNETFDPATQNDSPDSVTIDGDGVTANITDGDTSISADLDDDPSASVTTN
ncbi:hypothetical protein [Altericroceibacterium endophyticum]|uniref:Secreted protein n=1 Tax=Altericroceibacterium endophyticum TaxID=1808508 RepID=A0A6I4T403_9SPHN|nr:hypothetical protein [Altericroceibacterium endophyticum]MXO65039.1 hypothetical protein [Altericroceibacterium endophyticum]